MNIIFINLNINAKVIKVCVYLNAMFDDIFNDNKSKLSKFRSRDRSRDMSVCARNINRIFLHNILR